MNAILKSIKTILILLILIFAVWFIVANYSFVFSKKVVGIVIGIERIPIGMAVVQTGNTGGTISPQIFSYAVAVKDHTGEIFTSSAEDRQWAVVEKGKCVEAQFYPYPPWNFEKGGTFYNARLDRMFECPAGTAATAPAPAPAPPPAAAEPSH